jgi:hypothetical protein
MFKYFIHNKKRMDAEGFKILVSELEKPRTLKLIELVRHIVVNEKLVQVYETLNDLSEAVSNRPRELTPEESCVLEIAKERLKLLYDKLNQRAITYRDY